MCKCAKASREPTPTPTGTRTGTPSLTVLLLLRLIPPIAAHSSSWMQSAFDRLNRTREGFDRTKSLKDGDDGLPFSEGSEECLETFPEDHAG